MVMTPMTRWDITKLAVRILGGVAALAIVGDVYIIAATDHSSPVGLVAIASGCVGALATLVAGAVAEPVVIKEKKKSPPPGRTLD